MRENECDMSLACRLFLALHGQGPARHADKSKIKFSPRHRGPKRLRTGEQNLDRGIGARNKNTGVPLFAPLQGPGRPERHPATPRAENRENLKVQYCNQ